jgi:hypothetical protein
VKITKTAVLIPDARVLADAVTDEMDRMTEYFGHIDSTMIRNTIMAHARIVQISQVVSEEVLTKAQNVADVMAYTVAKMDQDLAEGVYKELNITTTEEPW